jgi:sugar lactone lactonase YvrE
MRIEIALDARSGVAEAPFWDADDGALWWVDITRKEVLRWRPGTATPRRWPVPDFPSAVVLRRRSGAVVALRDGLYLMELETGRLDCFCRPEADRPDNRTNEGKCDELGRFWVGTMQNNLNPDGSGREMTRNTGALYCVRPDGSSRREVDDVGLSNTLAWTADGGTLYFGDTLANLIWASTAISRPGGSPIGASSLTRSCQGSATARPSIPRGICGTRGSRVPRSSAWRPMAASRGSSSCRSPTRRPAALAGPTWRRSMSPRHASA